MTQIQEKELASLATILPAEEIKSIIHQGIMVRLPMFEARLAFAREKITQFQKKYDIAYRDLKSKGLPDNANYQVHEDFIEWGHWERVYKETGQIIKHLKRIL